MKNNVLRAPLIKSAILLVIFSLLVYFTSTSADGSIWSSIGMIFSTAFKVIQLSIGLFLGLAVCLLVLCGIFLGCVAMVSKESASGMYQHLLEMFQGSFQSLHFKQCTKRADAEAAFRDEINATITARLGEIKRGQAEQQVQLVALGERLERLEQNSVTFASAEQLESGLSVAAEKTQALEKQLSQLTPQAILGDLPAKVSALQQAGSGGAVNELKEQLDSLKSELAEVKTASEETLVQLDEMKSQLAQCAASSGTGDDTIYRICSYFSNPEECEQLKQLVSDTLGKDMTYAQVSEYVMENMEEEAAIVVRDHPALMKDYVRQRRQESEG